MLLSKIVRKVYQIRKYNDIKEDGGASDKKKNNGSKNKVNDEKVF